MVSSAPSEDATRASARDERASVHRWLRGHVPGEPGIWFFIFGDMTVFAVFFCVFLVARMGDPALFAAGRADLNTTIGMINTVVLLASSLLVAWGVKAFRNGDRTFAARLVTGGAACGGLFLLIKAFEYSTKIAAGITPMTNEFFLYYFVFTGIHAAHVVLGIGGLVLVRALAWRSRPGPNDQRTVEVAATFWHMVDFLWIVLFPLFYLTS